MNKVVRRVTSWWKSRLKHSPSLSGEVLLPASDLLNPWIYRDEKWNRVKRRFVDRKNLKRGKSITLIDDRQAVKEGIKISAKGVSLDVDLPGIPDQWVYLELDPAHFHWQHYRVNFLAKRDSQFRELQVAFRYQDFYNRYRLRQERGVLSIDVVDNGRFYNRVASCPFEMKLGETYRFAISVWQNVFQIHVDGEEVIRYKDPEARFRWGSVAVILWDDSSQPIRASFSEISVEELC